MCLCIALLFFFFFLFHSHFPHTLSPISLALTWMIPPRLCLFFFLVFSLILWGYASVCLYMLMRARLFQCLYIYTISCLLFGFAATHIIRIYVYTNTFHHVFTLPLRICLSCTLLTACRKRVYSDFSLKRAPVAVRSFSFILQHHLFILPQLFLTMLFWIQHTVYLVYVWAHFWISVGWH